MGDPQGSQPALSPPLMSPKLRRVPGLRDPMSTPAVSVGKRWLVCISPAFQLRFDRAVVAFCQLLSTLRVALGGRPTGTRDRHWPTGHRPCRLDRGGCPVFGNRGRHRQTRSGEGGWLAFRQPPVSGSLASQLRFDRAVIAFCAALPDHGATLDRPPHRHPRPTLVHGTPAVSPGPRRVFGLRDPRSTPVASVGKRGLVGISPAACFRFASVPAAFRQGCGSVLPSFAHPSRCSR